MNTPTEKIGRGLDALERQKTGSSSFHLSNIVGAPSSVTDLSNLTSKLTGKRDRLRVLAESIEKGIAAHREKKVAEFAEIGRYRDENGVTVDTLSETRRKTMLDREVNRFSRDARKLSAEERTKLQSEIRELSQKLAAVKSSWTDPVALLNRRTLADSKRATYAANLSSAGPVAVENALRDAVSTGNAALAMAALDRLDAMPKDSKKLVRFNKRDVAEALVQEEWAKANQFIAISELAVDEADLANAQAEGSRNVGMLNIRVGQKKQALGFYDDKPDDKPNGSEGGTKKLLSQDEWEANLNAKYPSAPVPDNVTVIGSGGDNG